MYTASIIHPRVKQAHRLADNQWPGSHSVVRVFILEMSDLDASSGGAMSGVTPTAVVAEVAAEIPFQV